LDVGLVITRIIHVVSGSFWVGTAIYLAVLLEPRIRSTSTDLERQLLNRTSKLNSLWITSASVITIVTGFALVSITPGRNMSDLGSGGWGTMILVGLIASVSAFFVSGWAGAFAAKLRRGLESGDASEVQLASYRKVLSMLGYANAILVVIAVSTMATARYA
jgi:putative copper export protein